MLIDDNLLSKVIKLINLIKFLLYFSGNGN